MALVASRAEGNRVIRETAAPFATVICAYYAFSGLLVIVRSQIETMETVFNIWGILGTLLLPLLGAVAFERWLARRRVRH